MDILRREKYLKQLKDKGIYVIFIDEFVENADVKIIVRKDSIIAKGMLRMEDYLNDESYYELLRRLVRTVEKPSEWLVY